MFQQFLVSYLSEAVEEETIEHLLVHCQQARLLWESILEIFGVSWVVPFSVWLALVGKKHKKVWRAAPLCLFWTIWRERNSVAFENVVFPAHKMKRTFIRDGNKLIFFFYLDGCKMIFWAGGFSLFWLPFLFWPPLQYTLRGLRLYSFL